MRFAFERLTEPLFGWIPDISDAPRSRQAAIGAVASVIIHALIFIIAILAMFVIPEHVERPPMAPVPKPEPQIELVVQEPPPLELKPLPPERKFARTEGLKAGEKPKDAKFESDRDMREASEVPATGTSELPGQEGEKAPMMRDFVNQDISLDQTKLALRQDRMQPLQPAPPQAASVAPMYQPLPLDDKARAEAEKAKPEEKLPEPAKPTRATPPPLKVKTPNEDQIAITQTPPAFRQEVKKPEPMPQREYKLATPAPLSQQSVASSFREQLKKTRNESVISNRGVAGVAAVNTPAGRWKNLMWRSFSQNWQRFIHERPDMQTLGSVKVIFSVDKTGGRPRITKIEPDSHAGLLTVQAAQRAVAETPLPPVPPDLLMQDGGEQLEEEVVFTLY